MKAVLDTNCLLVSIPKEGAYRWLFDALIEKKFILALSNEIIEEYEEKIQQFYGSPSLARNVIKMLLSLENKEFIHIYFNWNLIPRDPDDNKFADCAVAANADYLVSEDKDFNVLHKIDFPMVQAVRLSEFRKIIEPL